MSRGSFSSLSAPTTIANPSRAASQPLTTTSVAERPRTRGAAWRGCSSPWADAPDEVAGYYTLSAASFEKDELPAGIAKRLPHYPVPAVMIGRLAVSRAFQGRGFGEMLLLDAIRRVVRASTAIAAYAVVVDAKNDAARAFYERYGFRPFPSTPRRLFLPLQTFEKLGL